MAKLMLIISLDVPNSLLITSVDIHRVILGRESLLELEWVVSHYDIIIELDGSPLPLPILNKIATKRPRSPPVIYFELPDDEDNECNPDYGTK